MPIPDYQTLMLPLLRFAGQMGTYRFSDAVKALAEEFRITPEEWEARLPGGSQRMFTNRVSWAQMYLKKAALMETIGRATYTLTDRGRQLLAQNLPRVDKSVLRQFQEFADFEGARGPEASSEVQPIKLEADTQASELDPLEAFNRSYLSIQQNLADELLEMLKRTDPTFFEKLVVNLLVKMGYGGSAPEIRKSAMKGSQDKGIDGVIKEDVLGFSHIYIQAKRWKDSVGRPIASQFAGNLDEFHATKGVLITTSTFTADAKEYIRSIGKTIILIDGRQLVQLMLEHELGVKTIETYKIQAIDTSYYELEETSRSPASVSG